MVVVNTKQDLKEIDSAYAQAVAHFKPVFGNTRHIQIVESLNELGKLEREHAHKKKQVEGITALEKKIAFLKSQITWLKQEDDKNLSTA